MSKLSELLNPAPTSAQHSPPHPQPLLLDGQDHRAGHRSSFDGHATSPTRFASLTSPGLEALAAAASSTAPILSPPQSGTFAQSSSYQGYNHYGSRPGSSHTLPPLGNDFAHAGNQPSTHASDLEQYHHSSSGERKLSNETDYSTRLPPLVRSPPTQSNSFAIHAPGAVAQDDLIKYANGDTLDQVVLSSTQNHDEPKQDPYQKSDPPATSQIRQPSPGASDSILASTLPNTQSDQVEIKAEVQENSLETPQQYQGFAVEGSTINFDQSSNIGTPALKSITDIKNDASHTPSPVPPDSAAMKAKAAPSKKRAAPKKGTANTVKPPAKKRKIESESVDGASPAQHTGTPTTGRTSQTPVPKNRKQGSETPARSSSILNGEEDDDDDATDDGELFCICRKPDDHTLMIACDGPCDGWFHGRCVDMPAEKTKLISKWYCELFEVLIDERLR